MSIKRTQGSEEIGVNVSSAETRDILHLFKGEEFVCMELQKKAPSTFHELQKGEFI
jgi:hypothetical protein